MSPFWRHVLLTVLLAGAAGFAGVWVGARRLAPPPPTPAMLPSVVTELTARGLKGLTPEQQLQLTMIAEDYAAQRARLRHSIVAANFDLANALGEEMSMGPQTRASIERVKNIVGDLQSATVDYVLSLRQALSPEQQMVFDNKVVEALMADPK